MSDSRAASSETGTSARSEAPVPSAPPARPSVRRELLLSVGVLFIGAVVVALAALAVTLPQLESPAEGAFFISAIIVADLLVIFLFLRYLLRHSVFEPLESIGAHAERIASGAWEERIPNGESLEIQRLADSLNTMAEKFIADRAKLAENVASLDRTNQELVETTEELVRSARMASVGTLAAGLAHEVGNPLSALMAYLEVARKRADSGGEIEEPMEAALEEARRIDRIVRSVLDFSRPAGGKDDLTGVPIASVIDRALDLLEARGALEGVRVVRDEVPGEHRVRARTQHLEQILVNLLMNAVWAVRDCEEREIHINVRTGPVERDMPIKRRRDGDPPEVDYSHRRRIPLLLSEGTARRARASGELAQDVILEVRDSGPGIPEESLPHLFDPFFTTKEPGKGTGVGLAITTRIVQELGGKVEADNHPDGGARFTVRLPEVPEET
jgi:two-component system, NtrC family, sensor kinase